MVTPNMEEQGCPIPEFAARYAVTVRTVLERIKQGALQTYTVNGVIYVRDIFANPTGTNTAEDIYMLRGIEVAEIVGVTTRNLRYLVTSGKISCVWVGHQRRYSLAAVRRLVADRTKVEKGSHLRNRRRAAIVKWALERLATMDRIKVYGSTTANEYHGKKKAVQRGNHDTTDTTTI